MKTCTYCDESKNDEDFYVSSSKCKSCIKQIRKDYYNNNKSEVKTRVRKYQRTNKDKRNETARNSRKKNPDVYKEIAKRYYESHKEQKIRYQKAHRLANPEMYRQYCRKRRAKRKELEELYNKEDLLYTYALFNNACANCGSTEKLEIDHHIPLTKGHVLTRQNAVILCRCCNASKRSKLPVEFYSEEKLKEIEFLLAI